MKLKLFALLVFLGGFFLSSISSIEASLNIEYILDASNSMNELLPNAEKKIDAAKRVLCGLIDNIAVEAKDVNIGLRIYGSNFDPTATKEIACKDSVLVFPIAKVNASLLKQKIMSTKAAGYTPIAYSLELASKDFVISEEHNNMIVLVSDGLETCGGDPAAVARSLAEKGFAIKIYTIGLDVDAETRKQLEGISQATGGKYFDAKDADQLQKSLEEIKIRSFEEYEAAGKKVEASPWLATAPEIEPGEYKDKIGMHELKFYKVKVQKGQEIKASLIIKKTPYSTTSDPLYSGNYQTFSIKLFNSDLHEVDGVDKVVAGNPTDPITFKAVWKADITSWVYIGIAASKNHNEEGYPADISGTTPAPSLYTLKVKIKGEAGEIAEDTYSKFTVGELKGGKGFESAGEIKLNELVYGDIYAKETKFYKLPLKEGIKKVTISAVVQKPWYRARDSMSLYKINMTYSLVIYDEDWVEIARKNLTLSNNPATAYALNISADRKDNDELYVTLTATENHKWANDPSGTLDIYPEDAAKAMTKYTILATTTENP